jgi:hypothetical protein
MTDAALLAALAVQRMALAQLAGRVSTACARVPDADAGGPWRGPASDIYSGRLAEVARVAAAASAAVMAAKDLTDRAIATVTDGVG